MAETALLKGVKCQFESDLEHMDIKNFNAELREVRRHVSAGSSDLYMLMRQRKAQHEEHMAKLDRQHEEMMNRLGDIETWLQSIRQGKGPFWS